MAEYQRVIGAPRPGPKAKDSEPNRVDAFTPKEPSWRYLGKPRSTYAHAEWSSVMPGLVALGLRAADVPLVVEYVELRAEITHAWRGIRLDGLTVEGYRGSQVKNPALVGLNLLYTRANQIEGRLKLGLAGRPQAEAEEPAYSTETDIDKLLEED